MLRHLCGESGKTLDEPSILVAANLHPSDTARLPTDQVLGLLLQRGGATSHSAILARSLSKPAVVSVARALGDLEAGQIVGFDGFGPDSIPTATEVEALKAEHAARQPEPAEAARASASPNLYPGRQAHCGSCQYCHPRWPRRSERLG